MARGGGNQRLAACSEAERDSWIEVLHMASYSYIRVKASTIQKNKKEKNLFMISKCLPYRHKLHLCSCNCKSWRSDSRLPQIIQKQGRYRLWSWRSPATIYGVTVTAGHRLLNLFFIIVLQSHSIGNKLDRQRPLKTAVTQSFWLRCLSGTLWGCSMTQSEFFISY